MFQIEGKEGNYAYFTKWNHLEGTLFLLFKIRVNSILFVLLYFICQKVTLIFFSNKEQSVVGTIVFTVVTSKTLKTFDLVSIWKNYFYFARWEERLEVRKTLEKTGWSAFENILWSGSSEGMKITKINWSSKSQF